MAAIDSPRRILGERDVNKPVFTRTPPTAISPCKPTTSDASNTSTPLMPRPPQAVQSPNKHAATSSSTPANSPSGCRKRAIDCLTDIQDSPRRKQAVITFSNDGPNNVSPESSEEESSCSQSRAVEHNVSLTPGHLHSSTSGLLQRSVSPESSFDATQDSEILDSQLTNLTEPEDVAVHSLPSFATTVISIPRLVSQEEARENAEALRLRLKVAMYKVKTNQTDLPLSQLQVRSLKYHSLARTLLPASRPIARVPPTSYPSQSGDMDLDLEIAGEAEEPASPPSSSRPKLMSPVLPHSPMKYFPQSNVATPILPRSRNGLLYPDGRGSPEPGPEATSSLVKGRAADGLLRLMGADVPRRE